MINAHRQKIAQLSAIVSGRKQVQQVLFVNTILPRNLMIATSNLLKSFDESQLLLAEQMRLLEAQHPELADVPRREDLRSIIQGAGSQPAPD